MDVGNSNDHVLQELVEPLNHYCHVPLAALMVPPLVKTPITPNQVTYISVVFGLVAAYAFSLGTYPGLLIGALCLEASLVLDCVDGQLARAKNMASDWGRLVDGIGGYISNLGVVIGIHLGFPGNAGTLVTLTLLTVLRAVSYDYCKQFMTTWVKEGYDGTQNEVEITLGKLKSSSSMILKIYFYYLQLQQFLFNGKWETFAKAANRPAYKMMSPLSQDQRVMFYQNNRRLLNLWRWNGPDLVFFLIVITALLGILESSLVFIASLVAIQLVLIFMFHHTLIRYETAS